MKFFHSASREWKNISELNMKTIICRWRVRFGLLGTIAVVIFARPNLASLLTGGGILILGLLIRLWACGHLKKEQELATSGPYRYTRNPLYLGNLILGLGLVVAGHSWWGAIVCAGYFLVFYPIIILEEKDRIEKLFPEKYADYSAKVPLLFPFFFKRYPWEAKKFRWKNYKTNEEYRALIGILIFWAILFGKMLLFY